jgi:hypothetical protein
MRVTLIALALVAAAARADDGKALAPFLDGQTVAVLRLDLRKLDPAKLVEHVAAKSSLKPLGPAKATKEWAALVRDLVKDGAPVAYVVTALSEWPFEPSLVVVPLGEGADVPRLTKRLGELKKIEPTVGVSRVGEALVVGSPAVLKRLRAMKPAARPDLLAALGKDAGMARLAVAPTADARRVLEEMLPNLPGEVGGGPIAPLSRGLRWLALDVGAPPKLAARLTVQAADADSARSLDAMARRVLKKLAADRDVLAAAPDVARLAALWTPTRDGARLTLALDEKAVVEALRPHVEHLVETERQARAAGQMRQLLAAMLAYEKKHGSFPARASQGKDGKALLSWRVHLLPFLGEEKLYREFRLDEAWDGAHNRKLLARMPAAYRPESEKLAAGHRTTFLAPAGNVTMFPPGRGVRVAEVTDGTSQTALLVDAADDRAVEWTRPDDLKVDEKDASLPKALSTRYGGQYLVGLADGGARFLPGAFPAASLWALLTRGGAEVVELP